MSNYFLERAFRLEGQIFEIYHKMYRSRAFEQQLIKQHEQGVIDTPLYLSIGQEAAAASISTEIPKANIFCQHRNHSTYLSFGGDIERLREEFLFRENGCMGGRGGSMSLQFHNREYHMFSHHGFIGENIPLSVGMALADSNRPSICFAGDAAYEEDYCFPSLGFSATHKLPVLFIVEDNGLAILTPTEVRRNWSIVDVAKGFGLYAIELDDDPWDIIAAMSKIKKNLPALMNIKTCRHRWHAGCNCDGPPKQDRLELYRKTIIEMGFERKIKRIEKHVNKEQERLWRQ